MKKSKRDFLQLLSSLTEQESDRLKLFMDDWKRHVSMAKRDSKILMQDVQSAIMLLLGRDVSLERTLALVDSSNLGGFYAHEADTWYPLDDAAKIYPLSLKFGQMPMFRMSCTLNEEVIPQILQLALDFVIKRFPSFSTIVRKGIFWHYLDSVKNRFPVTEENGAPCQPLKISAAGAQSFRVLYYRSRISVEFFHVLTDGAGGMAFLKTLVAEYLRLLGEDVQYTDGVYDPNQSPSALETANEFDRLCPKADKSGGLAGKSALQMSGKLARHKPARVIQFVFNTDKLIEVAHRYNATVSSLMLAIMFKANKCATESLKGTIQMQLPVNMRKFYRSETLRNFSMYCSIDLPVDEIGDIGNLTEEIGRQIGEKATLEEMSVMMATSHKLVSSLKLIPIAIKAPIAKALYGQLGDGRFSNTLSNLGQVKMPEALSRHIHSFEFILSPCAISRAACSMCSFGNRSVFSISKSTSDPSFEEAFLRHANELGLESQVMGSPVYD